MTAATTGPGFDLVQGVNGLVAWFIPEAQRLDGADYADGVLRAQAQQQPYRAPVNDDPGCTSMHDSGFFMHYGPLGSYSWNFHVRVAGAWILISIVDDGQWVVRGYDAGGNLFELATNSKGVVHNWLTVQLQQELYQQVQYVLGEYLRDEATSPAAAPQPAQPTPMPAPGPAPMPTPGPAPQAPAPTAPLPAVQDPPQPTPAAPQPATQPAPSGEPMHDQRATVFAWTGLVLSLFCCLYPVGIVFTFVSLVKATNTKNEASRLNRPITSHLKVAIIMDWVMLIIDTGLVLWTVFGGLAYILNH